jgi:ADP-ribose pyrophosphatase YjhB (NUDIX family)
MPTNTQDDLIRAAGGLLWRRVDSGYEIALVHRNRYGDWTLPKGKLKAGESWAEAALREIKEETGFDAIILSFAGALTYEVKGRSKLVRYWHMAATGDGSGKLDTEVAEVVWLPVEAALARLQYPLERALLEECSGDKPCLGALQMRDSQNVGRKTWRDRWYPSLQRLRSTIEAFEPELETAIEAAQSNPELTKCTNWATRSRALVVRAKELLREGDADAGWRVLKVADRLSFYGLDGEKLASEATLILIEAADDGKRVSTWRSKSIRALLADDDGKLNSKHHLYSVVRARRTLDEHYDNVYHKLKLLRSGLIVFSLASALAVAAWIIFLPFRPKVVSVTSEFPTYLIPQRWLWVGLILTGILGALVSGFLSSIGGDKAKLKIPAELSATNITLARLSLAMVAAIAISILLLSGVLKISTPSYEIMLAVSFIAGFTDRLLVKAIESVVKSS